LATFLRPHRSLSFPYTTLFRSNAFLNTPWPKVSRATSLLQQYIDEHTTIEPAHIFSILQDQTIATDEQLPSTGVSLQLERQLSPESEEHTSELQSRFDLVCRLL